METTEQLEQDAEGHRANVESTLDRLKDRMSVDQMVGDVGRFLGISDPAAGLRSLGSHVKSNPIAFGMVGAGLAWLAIGGRATNKSPTQWSKRQWQSGGQDRDWHQRVTELTGKAEDQLGDLSTSVTDKASDMAQSARSHVQDGVNKVSDAAESLRQGLSERLENQPMMIGGLAVILGTIVGAALPRSRTEDNLMGQQRDQLLQEAKQASSTIRDRAVDAAQHTFDTAVESARDEGLLPHGDETLVSRVGAVAQAAMDEVKRQVEPVLSGEDDSTSKFN